MHESGRSSIALWHPVGLLSGEGWWGGVPDWPKNVWNNPSLGRLNDSCFRIPNNDMILLILSIYYCTYSYTKFDLPNSHLMFSSILFAIEKTDFCRSEDPSLMDQAWPWHINQPGYLNCGSNRFPQALIGWLTFHHFTAKTTSFDMWYNFVGSTFNLPTWKNELTSLDIFVGLSQNPPFWVSYVQFSWLGLMNHQSHATEVLMWWKQRPVDQGWRLSQGPLKHPPFVLGFGPWFSNCVEWHTEIHVFYLGNSFYWCRG